MVMRAPFLAAVCLFVAAATSQTFVVDAANGPGTDYPSIVAALAAVPDGAVLKVRAGTYSAFVVAGKGVTLLGEPGAKILVVNLGPVVENLLPHQSFACRGFELVPFFGAVGSASFTCRNNLGSVTLDAVNVTTGSQRLAVQQCDRVLVRGNSYHGQVTLDASNVVFQGCYFGNTNPGLPCITQQGGRVQLAGSLVVGQPAVGRPAGTAVAMTGGDLRVLGGGQLGSTAAPGQVGFAVAGTGTVRIDPSVTVFGGTSLFAPGVAVSTAPMPEVTVAGGLLGAPTRPALHGPHGHLGVLAIGFPGPTYTVPGIVDPFFWAPTSVVTQAVGVPAPGLPVASTVNVPNQPVWLGLQLVSQGITFDPVAGLQASNPVAWLSY